MPIRNPFTKRPEIYTSLDENAQPSSQAPAFERVDTIGSKASSVLSIKSSRSQEPAEYKMSVVNDSGVYLPPSPPDKKGLWPRRSNLSRTSTSTRNSESEEPFSISRESFDSYRRSFDISARSPVLPYNDGRQSLDSAARMPRLPRTAVGERRFETQPPTAEEGFEDVGLNDDQIKQTRKKGFFSKFGEGSDSNSQSTGGSRFHFTGRKRGQSAVGEELGNIQRPNTEGISDTKETTVKEASGN